MDSLDLAYRLGVKLALSNANQFQAAVNETVRSTKVSPVEDSEEYEDSTTRNLTEHNKHVAGNQFSDPIELGMGVDSIFMN
jgi:hypothetical protein